MQLLTWFLPGCSWVQGINRYLENDSMHDTKGKEIQSQWGRFEPGIQRHLTHTQYQIAWHKVVIFFAMHLMYLLEKFNYINEMNDTKQWKECWIWHYHCRGGMVPSLVTYEALNTPAAPG